MFMVSFNLSYVNFQILFAVSLTTPCSLSSFLQFLVPISFEPIDYQGSLITFYSLCNFLSNLETCDDVVLILLVL